MSELVLNEPTALRHVNDCYLLKEEIEGLKGNLLDRLVPNRKELQHVYFFVQGGDIVFVRGIDTLNNVICPIETDWENKGDEYFVRANFLECSKDVLSISFDICIEEWCKYENLNVPVHINQTIAALTFASEVKELSFSIFTAIEDDREGEVFVIIKPVVTEKWVGLNQYNGFPLPLS